MSRCLVCERMEPIKAPVWDDPVPKAPYKLKDLPPSSIGDGIRYVDNNFTNPCKTQKEADDEPPADWTRRGRRDAVWEIELDPALVSPTACYDTQSEDLDPCYRVCLCTRRNGLQDTCPLTGCGGRPPCLTTPTPSCEPSGFAKPPDNFHQEVKFILCPAHTKDHKFA